MFHDVDPRIWDRMAVLEAVDLRDRSDGTPLLSKLRQIPPETGRLLAPLLACSPEGRVVEIGTSAGYSTLWLALAARATGRTIRTFESLPEKIALARETFDMTEVWDVIDLVEGDALDTLADQHDVAFCFLDVEKHLYSECYELIVPNLVPGGLLAADNTINHRPTLGPLIARAARDDRIDTAEIPIGMGALVVRKI
jgi:caffeoyl-CoA O-methyltransferase